jgi:hypothetical protein
LSTSADSLVDLDSKCRGLTGRGLKEIIKKIFTFTSNKAVGAVVLDVQLSAEISAALPPSRPGLPLPSIHAKNMMKSKTTVVYFFGALLALIFLSGCANFGKDHLFESRPEVVAAQKQFAAPPDGLATVYLISEKMFLQDFSHHPQPSFGFVVNDRLVTIAPRGSFIKLTFQEGRHKIGLMAIINDKAVHNSKVSDLMSLTVVSGRTYFVAGKLNFGSGFKLAELQKDVGSELVKDYLLAKSIHIPISLVPFEEKQRAIADAEQKKKIEFERQNAINELKQAQTAEGLADFFAGAAAVALVALFVVGFGLALSASQPSAMPPSMASFPDDPPAYRTAPAASRSAPTSVRSASGKTIMLETTRNAEVTSINNLSSGVRYRLEGDRYLGSDGSWYRMSGNTIFSSTGNTYTRSGNVLTSNDGRECQIIGSMISCR